MLTVIRRRQWLRRRLRQARRPALTAARSAWLVTLVLVAARSSTLLRRRSLRRLHHVIRAVVIWRLRRLIGTVLLAIQALRGVAAVGRRTRAVIRTSRVLPAPVLVLVLRILPRLWMPAVIPAAVIRLLLRVLLLATKSPAPAGQEIMAGGSCPHWVSSTRLTPPTSQLLTMVLVG